MMTNMCQRWFILINKNGVFIAALGTGLLIILQGLGEGSIALLRYNNSIVQTGEWWRLITGNFIHLSWAHLMMNLAGLWILISMFHQIIKPIILPACLLLGLGVSLGLLFFNPDVTWYVGLSGILHGFVVMGLLVVFRSRSLLATISLVGITLKLLWEQFFADAYGMEATIGGKVIYDAHLYGAITGAIITASFILISLFYSLDKNQEE